MEKVFKVNQNDVLIVIKSNGTILGIDIEDSKVLATESYEELMRWLPFCDQGHEPLIHGGKIDVVDEEGETICGNIVTPSEMENCIRKLTSEEEEW